jgi:(2R)-3-sulfolactate dehydrogenase (NADP+)
VRLSTDELRTQVAAALRAAGANPLMADSSARSLVLAEAQGLGSHGLSRVAQYIAQLRNRPGVA